MQYLWEVGPVTPGGMGAVPVSFGELAQWQQLCGLELPRWQTLALRQLSVSYLAEQRRAEKPDSPAPWTDVEQAAPSRDHIARHVRSLLR